MTVARFNGDTMPETAAPRRKIAIYTGSFDPPTLFHRGVAADLRGMGFDEVLIHPLGPRADNGEVSFSAPIHRAVMIDLTFRDLDGIRVDLHDLDEGISSENCQIAQRLGDADVWHVVSSDFIHNSAAMESIIQCKWGEGGRLFCDSGFVVVCDPHGEPKEEDLPSRHVLLCVPDANHLPTAYLREMVFHGKSIAAYVSPGVSRYIQRQGLYSGRPVGNVSQLGLDQARLMIFHDPNNPKARALADRYRKYESNEPNMILAIGGDGTMLAAIRKHWRERLPFFGINAGHLGFLMNEHAGDELDVAGLMSYRLPMLRVDTEGIDGTKRTNLAFGDAWVERDSGQAAWIKLDVDGQTRVEKLVGDGLLLAVPAGSSAYARAMGGTPVPLSAPVLTLAGSNVFRPRFWKPVALPMGSVVAMTNLDPTRSDKFPAGKRPIRGFLDGEPVGQLLKMTCRVSDVASVELAFTPEFDPAARLLRSLFPPEEELREKRLGENQ